MKIVTTVDGVVALTREILKAEATSGAGRASYLRALVQRTQHELGSKPRERTARSVRLDDAGIEEQLAALSVAHEEFYAAVLRVCSEDLPGGTAKAKELNRRSNFARTALSSVRGWIKSGRDITAVAAVKATKASLAVERAAAVLTPRKLTRKIERGVTELITSVNALATQDKAAAVRELEQALSVITHSLAALGTSATRDPAKALAERIPLRTRHGVFVPVQEQGAPP